MVVVVVVVVVIVVVVGVVVVAVPVVPVVLVVPVVRLLRLPWRMGSAKPVSVRRRILASMLAPVRWRSCVSSWRPYDLRCWWRG